ncbi:MAG: DUF4255 domain-containing protein [Cyanobacteria bacterium P01_F01_bin.53]
MSNHLAIATVTATLQKTLQSTVQTEVEGARITTVSPSEIGKGTPETGVNIFMYQVITNPALHNMDATLARSRGNPVKRQAALDLYYMLSFYGNNNELVPQRLLGSAVRTLNDKRVISQDMIRAACTDSTFSFLAGSDLANQVQHINLLPLDLNLEDLSKTWSVFFQTPYVLSVAYKCLVVLVEGDDPFKRALPVREARSGGISPFPNQPRVETVVAQTGQHDPILVDSTLVIKGKHLKGERFTKVRIGGVEVMPTEVQDTEIKLELSTLPNYALRAGIQSLQVIHPQSLTEVDRSHGRRGAESAGAPFVLRPRVMSVAVENSEETDNDTRDAALQVQLNLTVGREQTVVLALNESATDNPTSYMFDIPPRDSDSNQVSIPVQDVKPGEYLVRLLIDSAESQLEVDTEPDSPTKDWYIGPKALIL